MTNDNARPMTLDNLVEQCGGDQSVDQLAAVGLILAWDIAVKGAQLCRESILEVALLRVKAVKGTQRSVKALRRALDGFNDFDDATRRKMALWSAKAVACMAIAKGIEAEAVKFDAGARKEIEERKRILVSEDKWPGDDHEEIEP